MRFREIVNRLTGVSTPVFGASWTRASLDHDVARRSVAFVVSRRVLMSTYTNEVPEECVQSVLEIRNFLIDVVGSGGIAAELLEPLRLMRRYCVRFLDRVGANEDRGDADASGRHLFREPRWRMHAYWSSEALGELRSDVGLQVAIIAASFGRLSTREPVHEVHDHQRVGARSA